MKKKRSHQHFIQFTSTGIAIYLLLICNQARSQSSFQIELPLIINQASTGDISSSINETVTDEETLTNVDISIARFIELAKPFANDEQLSTWLELDKFQKKTASRKGEVKSLENQTSTIALSTLQSRGLDIDFDPGSLSIIAIIPRLGTQGISLSAREVPNPNEYYQESFLASGLNVIARNNFNHKPSNGTPEGFGDATIDIAGFTSIGGFNGVSLFYEGSYIENDAREFARQNVTLIHDNFKNSVRYTLGDIRPSTSDLQSSPDLLGFNIERNYQEINPFRNINPNGLSTFTLDRSARVSFEVNGVIVDTQNLDAGSYSIRDFPLTAGANDVRVLIDDGTSRLEVANFSTFVDFDLLDPGLSDFGISAGLQKQTDSGRALRYDDDLSLLAFYTRGINQNLTLGLSVEAKKDHRLVASNVVYGTKFGLFAAQVAASQRKGLETGYNSIINYNLNRNIAEKWSLEADLQATYQTDQFVNINTLTPSAESWSTNARLALASNIQNFSIDTGVLSNDGIKTNSFSTTYTRQFRGLSLSAGYRYSKTGNDESDKIITLRVSTRFGKGRLRTQYRSSDNEYRTDWNSRSSRNINSIEGAIAVIDNNSLRSGQLDASYTGARFEFNAQHLTSSSKTLGDDDESATNLTLAGSVGYADGKLAFGRPFTEGFIIVNPHKNLRGKRVDVTQGSEDGDVITSTKILSTTLVPLDSSYREQRYSFDVNELPIGYDLGSGDVSLYPKFLSGYNFKLGSDAANTVLGKVLWPDETPLQLMSGRLVPEDGSDSLPVFTNKTGRFVAEKALYGRYTLVFIRNDIKFTSQIVIPESDAPGLTQVGTLTLAEQEQ